ncbi:MAG: hypothetical protein U5L96_09455 [Owenweeksia sp.]|nr:hypothetical protein [Owenweeksia sp.]
MYIVFPHSTWNQNTKHVGLSYNWADMVNDFTADGVQFQQNSGSKPSQWGL